MAFSIVTNAASLLAQDNLRITGELQQKTIQRLTSGLRINSSADDAAGLAIANSFRSDVSVLQQGVRNANDGLSTLQTIDGGINNISLLLDRARTLATQSASGTFTGDRNVLDSEFGSVLSEIDRQAQSIGLDPGGTFAKLLSVFIGGGRAHAGQATQVAILNGSVSIDLSSSSVNTKSLGLAGLQVLGGTAGTTDLSSASSTSVANILADTTNTASEANSGFTTLYFSGPGFSDSGKIAVSVNLTGVTDTNTLASALNAAIQAAGNGTTAAATAFKNANITASVNTDSTGKQQIAFNSGNVAFQVQAGDLVSNALLGNFSSGAVGASLTTTVTGSAATPSAVTTASGAETVDLRFQGAGLTSPVDLSLSIASGATVGGILSALQTAVNGDPTLKNAGITLATATAGSALVFQNSQGQQFTVGVSGDTQNLLGLGTFQAGSGGAFDYNTITGPATYAASAANSGSQTLEFSFNGAASAVTAATVTGSAVGAGTVNTTAFGSTALQFVVDGTTVSVNFANDPNVSATESLANIVKYINSTARTALGLGANVSVASLNGQIITLTSPTTGTTSSLTVTDNAEAVALGLTAGAGNVAAAGTGSDGFTINLAGGTATAATTTGSSIGAATVNTTAFGSTALAFSVDGTAISASFTNDANVGATETLANVVAFLNTTARKALGTSATLVSANASNQIIITSPTTGLSSAITVTSNATATGLGFGAVSVAGTAPAAQDIVNRLNQGFGQSSALSAAGLQASYSSASDKFTIASSNGTFFQLNTRGTAAGSDIGFGVTGAAFAGNAASPAPTTSPVVDAGGSNVSSQLSYSPIALGNASQTVTISAIDSSGAQQSIAVILQNNGTARNAQNIDDAIHAINAALQQSNISVLQGIVAVKDDSSGTEKIRFLSGSSAFNVNIGTNADGSGFSPQGAASNSTVSAGGSTATIATQSNAETAVTLLATAISLLGSAQAVVGRGANQLQFAIGLASTQVNNLSIAQGRIRDADLAAEAANLTRASIAQQAGVAALAQANSAPQAVLALLRG